MESCASCRELEAKGAPHAQLHGPKVAEDRLPQKLEITHSWMRCAWTGPRCDDMVCTICGAVERTCLRSCEI
eukprot:44201-Prymnesium_polylepis.1